IYTFFGDVFQSLWDCSIGTSRSAVEIGSRQHAALSSLGNSVRKPSSQVRSSRMRSLFGRGVRVLRDLRRLRFVQIPLSAYIIRNGSERVMCRGRSRSMGTASIPGCTVFRETRKAADAKLLHSVD